MLKEIRTYSYVNGEQIEKFVGHVSNKTKTVEIGKSKEVERSL